MILCVLEFMIAVSEGSNNWALAVARACPCILGSG